MPTIMTHAAVPLALAVAAGRTRIAPPVALAGMALAMLPDADVIGFPLGIPYASEWGHRGASHALVMAGLVALIATALLKPARLGPVSAFLLVSAASHGLLDALTNGGLGPALLWPFSEQRLFAPFQPIRVSPIGAGFFSMRGVETLVSEALWVWVPCLLLALAGLALRRTSPHGRLQALEDREAIRDLIARYGPLADSGDAEGVAALWSEDGVYAVEGFGESRGRAAIATLITGETHQRLMADGCAHLLGPVAITVEGDHATATGHSVVLRHGAAGFEVYRVAANRWALVRTPDGWRVARRDNALLSGGAAARALLNLRAAPRPS